MDPLTLGITSSYLSSVAATLTQHIFAGALKKLRNRLYGTESQQALKQCVRLGVIGTLTRISKELSGEEVQRVKEIFKTFFDNPDVGRELAGILGGKKLDMEEMNGLFHEAGYDPSTLPGLPFEQAILTFEAVFIEAMDEEPVLQPIIQIKEIRKQTHLQEALLDEMRELVSSVKGLDIETIGIQAGKVMAEAIGEQKRVLYETGQIPERVPDDWERFYLRRVITKCDQLDLSAIDDTTLQGQVTGEKGLIKISDVFTTLFLKGVTRSPRQPIKDALVRHRGQEMKEARRDEGKPVPIQAVEAAGAMERLIVLGRPGGGKSTLSNHIAATLANLRLGGAEKVEKLPGWDQERVTVPVRIILREFAAWIPADSKCGKEGLVWEYLEHLLSTWGCQEYFSPLKYQLDDEGGVIFFDGLDEVREEDKERKRSLIVESISAFAAPLRKCRIMVTCREYAYQKGSSWRLPDEEFPVVELDLFKDEQIKAFTRTWYMTTGKWKGWDAERCTSEAEVLFEAIESLPHLRELGQYPLLLTLMAQVHGRDGYLPKDRADLYERVVNLLLSHWENRIVRDEKGGLAIEQGIIMKLGIRTGTVRKALENVSLAAHERQQKEGGDVLQCANIPREDLRQELTAISTIDWNRAEEIIRYIEERAGLLQARDSKIFTFPHRTFQEYLAASCIKRRGDYEEYLRDRIREELPWWREVFLLAAGTSRDTPKIIHDLIDVLIPNEYDEGEMSRETILYGELAAQAMDETGFITSVDKERLKGTGRFTRIHKRVQEWLLGAITADTILQPAERSSAGTALAKIGDPRFDPERWYLPKEGNMGFIRIEAGEFQMGSDQKDSDAGEREFPRHTVYVSEFSLSRYPVTVAQFRVFIEESGYDAGKGWQSGVDNHPVVDVSWDDAAAYCRWLSGKLKEAGLGEVRLPTEAEWEKAARGETETIYPWGDEPDSNKMNYDKTGIGGTSPVGCFPGSENPYGLLDMHGNVLEWVEDDYHDDYEGAPEEGSAWVDTPERGSDRVLRGGSWFSSAGYCRSANRGRFP